MKVVALVTTNAKSCETLQQLKNAVEYGIKSIPRTNHIPADSSYKIVFTDDTQTVLQLIHRVKEEKVLATITEE